MAGFAGRTLIAGLCIAAATAIAALLTGEFGETHGRVIGTSLGFGVFSALGASGDAVWRQARDWRRGVGAVTAAAALLGFVSLVLALWLDDDSDTLWRAFGVLGLLAFAGSHASLVLRLRRTDDTSGVTALVWTSIAATTFDMLVADIAIIELVDDIDEAFGRLAAAVLVVMLLTTALPPLLRRSRRPDTDPLRAPAGDGLTLSALTNELLIAADRLDRVETSAGARREAAALRELAARARR